MKRENLEELHYITPIANVPSILQHGILSHNQSRKVQHVSVAKSKVQELRQKIVVPGGRRLHDYANLYLCARNPMMYLRKDQHAALCILRVAAELLDERDVVITDQNAASGYARFGVSPQALEFVDGEKVFAQYWTHPDDPVAELRHKSIKCAEVLVPNRAEARHIQGAYVSCEQGRLALDGIAPELPLTVSPYLFFQA